MPRTAGAGIAALGLALLLAAGLLDAEPLYVPGIGLLALVAGAHAWVALAVPGAEVSRALATRRVEEGQPVEVVLELAVSGLPLPGGTLEDPLLPAGAPLPALRSEWGSEDPLALRRGRLRLSASFARRGRRRLAPPVLAIGDPLGLARRRVPGTGEVQEILVLPRLAPVESESGGGGGGLGTLAAGWAAAMEVDGLRPYREGAPASRIHWPAVARRGDLVERRLRAESEARPIVVLDARAPASEAALDAAVRAAASLAHALGRGSGCALALPGERRPSEIEPDLGSWPLAHARLALVEAGGMAPVPASGQSRRGAVVYVAARPLTRLPAAWAGIARGPRLLVLPDGLGGADAPVLRVAGCTGHALLARASAPREAAA